MRTSSQVGVTKPPRMSIGDIDNKYRVFSNIYYSPLGNVTSTLKNRELEFVGESQTLSVGFVFP